MPRSRSLEIFSNPATWSEEVVEVVLRKGEKGLGFSILDYQDPCDLNNTVIVVRGLVPGGAAHQDGRIIPGDRVMFVNQTQLTRASLDLAVQALKGAPLGLVRVGVCKPRNSDALNTQDSLVRPAGSLGESDCCNARCFSCRAGAAPSVWTARRSVRSFTPTLR